MSEKVKEIKEKIANFIQKKRVNSDISIQDLSIKSHELGVSMSKNTLERIETGAISPNPEQLYTILVVLGCNLQIDKEIIIDN